MRTRLFSKFLLVLAPVFLLLAGVGLYFLASLDLRSDRALFSTRIGNLSARVVGALERHGGEAVDPVLAQDLLAPLAAERAVTCAELRAGADRRRLAALPPALGCDERSGGQPMVFDVGDFAEATLLIRVSEVELVDAAAKRGTFALLVLGVAFLIAVASASLGFRLIVARPLGRLRAAISRAAETGERVPLAAAPNDEIGDLIVAFNAQVLRDTEHERQLERARAELAGLNRTLEQRVAERTEALRLAHRQAAGSAAAADRARRRAERASQAKSEFLATMSHEIRTPIHGVLGMLELLLEERLPDDQQQLARNARRSGEILLALVNDILDFSKIESGKLVLERTDFDLRRIVREVDTLLLPTAGAKGLELGSTVVAEVPVRVTGDPGRLRQILINLIGNAVKFTERGGVDVAVEVASPTDDGAPRLHFTITDSGCGIEPEAQARLFAAFSQADASTTRRYGGTGLGLAICRRLVELMGGAIGVRSEPGRGSTFWFTLPLAPAGAPAEEVRAPQPGRCELRGHVLVVDDNPLNQMFTAGVLRKLGCTYEMAGNGAEAVAAAARRRYDLILMDCQMPELDGFAATKQIRAAERRASRRRVPVIALTANAFAGDRSRCLAVGMDDYLPKPFRLEDLRAVSQRWLAVPADAGVGRTAPLTTEPSLPL